MIPAVLLATAAAALAGPPSWALRDTQRLEGKLYRAVCSGTGPSIGFARQDAIDSCKVSAAQHLPTEITVKSMSVTSERDGAYAQEVRNRARVSGLVCAPRREAIEERETGVRVWILCEFDLSRAHAARERLPARDEEEEGEWIRNREELETTELARYVTDRRKVLTLAVIPRCTDLIVRGGSPARVIRCDRNPISILVEPDDREVLVRSDGRFPKTVLLGPSKESRGYAKVILEPML